MIRPTGDYIPSTLLAGEFLVFRFGATLADYEAIATEDTRLELIDGVLVMHSPANVGHERLFHFLSKLLGLWVGRHDMGVLLGSRTPMILDDRRFEPDLLFIRKENLYRLGEVALDGPADLVVEILSPATSEYDMGKKRTAYAEGGVPEYWIIDRDERQFLVDRPAGKRYAQLPTGLYQTPALPGFTLNVDWLWQDPLPDPLECLQSMTAKR